MRPFVPAVCLLAACAPVTDEVTTDDTGTPVTADDLAATFAARGPFHVGYAESSLTYDDAVTDGDRTLRLATWFPTDDEGTGTAAFPGPHAAEDCRTGATPADGPWPIAIFSHGHQGDTDNATNLMAQLASHGWYVVAPEHTGNTLSDGDNRTTAIYLQRPFDISATLDHVIATQGDLVDDSRILGLGHSFGGYTIFALAGASWAVDHWDPLCKADAGSPWCSEWTPENVALMRDGAADDRIDAFISLNGGNWGQFQTSGFATLDGPLLQVTGSVDTSVTDEGSNDPIWRDLPAGTRAAFAHGDHQTSMDFAGAGGGVLPGTSADALDWERGYRATYILVGAWAERHVVGDGTDADALDELLDGTYEIDPDLTVSVKP